MSTGLDDYTYVSDRDGLKWFVYPGVGIRNESVVTNYGFNITSTNENLVRCKIELLNLEKTILLSSAETTTTNSSYCNVETSYQINSTYPQIKGRLLVDLGEGYQILEDDAHWSLLEINSSGLTFSDWFNSLSSSNFGLNYFGDNEQHREYTYILIFFLVVAIIGAVLNSSGWDIQTNGGIIFLIGVLIWIASIPGFLNLAGVLGSPFAAIDKFFVAIVYTMFMIGFATREFT
jgi:hypothetical protein